jgi:anti-sigma-K factor RskA
MNNMDEQIEDLFPFYAMGAVTEEESAEVEAYIRDNPAAQARLDAALAAADNLAYLAEPMTPAAPVRSQVLAYARRRPHASAAPAAPAAPITSWWQRWRQSLAMPAFAGLATAVAVFLFIWTLSLQSTIDQLQNQVADLQETLVDQETILALLPNGRSVPIASNEGHQPEAIGQLVVGEDGRTAVLAVSHLHALPADETYQLWLIGTEGPVSEGIFAVDDTGEALVLVTADSAVFGYDAVGISIEPEGGSPQPTGDIVMLSNIPSPDSGS